VTDERWAVPWWRWLGGFWAALAIAAGALRAWGALATGLLFCAGVLAQEFWPPGRSPLPPRARTALAVVAAAIGAAGVTLTLRFTFSVPAGWAVGVPVFAVLVGLYAAGPGVADRYLTRSRP
jgi:hypothetical protein